MTRLILLPLLMLAAGPVPADNALPRKCDALVARWKERFETEKLTCLTASPFVIAGDAPVGQLARYRDGTILSAAHALKAMYFKAEPSEPILILLFESSGPYQRLSRQWFHESDPPHFGYCRADGVMVMNVGTGTGTLVHELVHALMRPDFPKVPDWFNEGLASLYEQSSLAPESIRGLENWRLPALQKAIRAETLRPLSQLIDDHDFYAEQSIGLNYAQARYVMFYLQEKGLLRDFYARFRDAVKDDPTGLNTLKTLLAPQSLDQFEKDWRQWVLTLRFPS